MTRDPQVDLNFFLHFIPRYEATGVDPTTCVRSCRASPNGRRGAPCGRQLRWFVISRFETESVPPAG
jgi:hypothetical protein